MKITEPMFDYGLAHVGDPRLPRGKKKFRGLRRLIARFVRRDRLGRLCFARHSS